MADKQQRAGAAAPAGAGAAGAAAAGAPAPPGTIKVKLPATGSAEVTHVKQTVTELLADLIEHAVDAEMGHAAVGAVRYNVPRPDIVKMAREATDEAFGSILATAGGRIRHALADELGSGKRPIDIGDSLALRFAGASKAQARRTVRTMTRDLYNAASLAAWEKLGVEEVVASDGHGGLTGQTDAACLARNGKTFTITEARELRALHNPTVHPNCTLSFRPVIPASGLQPHPDGTMLSLAVPGQWEPDQHPRWPKGTPGVDKLGHHLAGEFLTIGNILDMLKGTLSNEKDISFLGEGSNHIKAISVSHDPGVPNTLDFSIALQAPGQAKAAQVKLRLEGDFAKLDDPGKTGAFMDYLAHLDQGWTLPEARKVLAGQLKGGTNYSYANPKWAVKPTHTSKAGHAAFTSAVAPKVAGTGAPDLDPNALKGIEVSAAGKISLPVKPMSSNTEHDPSIPIPEGSKVSEFEWKRFGKADQERYVFLQQKFGTYDFAKAKKLMAEVNAKANSTVVSHVKTMYDHHYGHHNQPNQLNLKAFNNMNLGALPPDVAAKHKSWQDAANDLLLRHEELAQWDLYNRLRDPEVMLIHCGNQTIKSNLPGKLRGTLSWSLAPGNWHGSHAYVTPMAISNITMHFHLRALNHNSFTTHEYEFSSRYDLQPDLKKLVVTDLNTASKSTHLWKGGSLEVTPGSKFEEIAEAMGVDPVGGPLDPAKKYSKYPPISVGDLNVGDKFVDANFVEHKVGSIDPDTGFVHTQDNQSFPPTAPGKLMKQAPQDVGKLVDFPAESFGIGQLVYSNEGTPVAYKQSVPGFKSVEAHKVGDVNAGTITNNDGVDKDGAGVKFNGEGATFKSVQPHEIEDLSIGDEFWVPDAHLAEKATVTSFGPNGTVKASNGKTYFAQQVVEILPKPDSAFVGKTKPKPHHVAEPPPAPAAVAAAPGEGEPFGVYSIKAKYLKQGDTLTNKDGSKDLGIVMSTHPSNNVPEGHVLVKTPDGGEKLYKKTSTVNKKGPPKTAPAAPAGQTDALGDVLGPETQVSQLSAGDFFKPVAGGSVVKLLSDDGTYQVLATEEHGELPPDAHVYPITELKSNDAPPPGFIKTPVGQTEYSAPVWYKGKLGQVVDGDGVSGTTLVHWPDGEDEHLPGTTVVDADPEMVSDYLAFAGPEGDAAALPLKSIEIGDAGPNEHIFTATGDPLGHVITGDDSDNVVVYWYPNVNYGAKGGLEHVDNATPVYVHDPGALDPTAANFAATGDVVLKPTDQFKVGESVFAPTGYTALGTVVSKGDDGLIISLADGGVSQHGPEDWLHGKPHKPAEDTSLISSTAANVEPSTLSADALQDLPDNTPIYDATGELYGVLGPPEGQYRKIVRTDGSVEYLSQGANVHHVDPSLTAMDSVAIGSLQVGDTFKYGPVLYTIKQKLDDGNVLTQPENMMGKDIIVQVEKKILPEVGAGANGKPKSIKAKYLKPNDYVTNKKGEVQGVVVANDPQTEIVHWMTNDGTAKQYGYKSTIWKQGAGAPDPLTPSNLAPAATADAVKADAPSEPSATPDIAPKEWADPKNVMIVGAKFPIEKIHDGTHVKNQNGEQGVIVGHYANGAGAFEPDDESGTQIIPQGEMAQISDPPAASGLPGGQPHLSEHPSADAVKGYLEEVPPADVNDPSVLETTGNDEYWGDLKKGSVLYHSQSGKPTLVVVRAESGNVVTMDDEGIEYTYPITAKIGPSYGYWPPDGQPIGTSAGGRADTSTLGPGMSEDDLAAYLAKAPAKLGDPGTVSEPPAGATWADVPVGTVLYHYSTHTPQSVVVSFDEEGVHWIDKHGDPGVHEAGDPFDPSSGYWSPTPIKAAAKPAPGSVYVDNAKDIPTYTHVHSHEFGDGTLIDHNPNHGTALFMPDGKTASADAVHIQPNTALKTTGKPVPPEHHQFVPTEFQQGTIPPAKPPFEPKTLIADLKAGDKIDWEGEPQTVKKVGLFDGYPVAQVEDNQGNLHYVGQTENWKHTAPRDFKPTPGGTMEANGVQQKYPGAVEKFTSQLEIGENVYDPQANNTGHVTAKSGTELYVKWDGEESETIYSAKEGDPEESTLWSIPATGGVVPKTYVPPEDLHEADNNITPGTPVYNEFGELMGTYQGQLDNGSFEIMDGGEALSFDPSEVYVHSAPSAGEGGTVYAADVGDDQWLIYKGKSLQVVDSVPDSDNEIKVVDADGYSHYIPADAEVLPQDDPNAESMPEFHNSLDASEVAAINSIDALEVGTPVYLNSGHYVGTVADVHGDEVLVHSNEDGGFYDYSAHELSLRKDHPNSVAPDEPADDGALDPENLTPAELTDHMVGYQAYSAAGDPWGEIIGVDTETGDITTDDFEIHDYTDTYIDKALAPSSTPRQPMAPITPEHQATLANAQAVDPNDIGTTTLGDTPTGGVVHTGDGEVFGVVTGHGSKQGETGVLKPTGQHVSLPHDTELYHDVSPAPDEPVSKPVGNFHVGDWFVAPTDGFTYEVVELPQAGDSGAVTTKVKQVQGPMADGHTTTFPSSYVVHAVAKPPETPTADMPGDTSIADAAAAAAAAGPPKNIKAKYLKPGDVVVTKAGKPIGVVATVDGNGAHVALVGGGTKSYSLKGSIYKAGAGGGTAAPSAPAAAGGLPEHPPNADASLKAWQDYVASAPHTPTQIPQAETRSDAKEWQDLVPGTIIYSAATSTPHSVVVGTGKDGEIMWMDLKTGAKQSVYDHDPVNGMYVWQPPYVYGSDGVLTPGDNSKLVLPDTLNKPPIKPTEPGPNAGGSSPTIPHISQLTAAQIAKGKAAGGTTGAKFVYDEHGSRWLVKTYGGDEDRAGVEAISNRIYDLLGVPVPKGGMVTVDGKQAYAHETVDGSPKHIHGKSAALGDGYAADAYLANWDVIGLDHDNIIWSPNGTPYRVDFGGTLDYRAQGKKKQFTGTVTELETLLSKGQAKNTMDVTQADKVAQVEHLVQVLTPGVIDQIVNSSSLSPARKSQISEKLKARRDWLAAWLKSPEGSIGV